MKPHLWLVFSLVLPAIATAGKVRTLTVGSKKMYPIYLAMGKSTVLHFNEVPKKIICGNQNYVNIEFTGNDVTIQPLGSITTNLFVYGEYHRYGFLLKTSASGSYDDLVSVRWKTTRIVRTGGTKKKRKVPQKELELLFPGKIKATIHQITRDKYRQLHIIDLELENLSDTSVSLSNNSLKITRRSKPLPFQGVVFERHHLEKRSDKTKARILLRLKKREAFSLWLQLGTDKKRVVIPTKHLRWKKEF